MKIVVCVKQVPDTSLPIEIDSQKNAIVQTDTVWILNPCDRQAVEEAVRIYEGLGGGEVIVVTMGPPRADKALRTCLSMGAHRVIRIWDNALENSDTFATATVLAKAIAMIGYDLILCGKQAIDGDTGQVGTAIAELLDLPVVSGVTKIDFSANNGYAMVQKKLERGNREVVECPLPALLTIELGINEPRYASLPAHMASLRADVSEWSLRALGVSFASVGQSGSPAKVVGITPPRPRPKKLFTPDSSLPAAERMRLLMTGGLTEKKGDLLEGAPKEVASQVIQFLTREKIVVPQEAERRNS